MEGHPRLGGWHSLGQAASSNLNPSWRDDFNSVAVDASRATGGWREMGWWWSESGVRGSRKDSLPSHTYNTEYRSRGPFFLETRTPPQSLPQAEAATDVWWSDVPGSMVGLDCIRCGLAERRPV